MDKDLNLNINRVRQQPVVVDSDIATIHEVTTGNFNKAVQRNSARFPDEFSFFLISE